jgi:hypothetical protein
VVAPVSAEPGFIVECDSCFTNLTHSVRIRCADPVCDSSSTDICADCFRQGKEFGRHKANHPYRIIEKHHTPIFDEEWEADELVSSPLATHLLTLSQGSHVVERPLNAWYGELACGGRIHGISDEARGTKSLLQVLVAFKELAITGEFGTSEPE